MKKSEFENIVKKRTHLINEVLGKKNTEYATEEDCFHNFKAAGKKESISPVAALRGMMLKHVISVDDLMSLYEKDASKLKEKVIEEKLGDYINYLILLEGLLLENLKGVTKMSTTVLDERKLNGSN